MTQSRLRFLILENDRFVARDMQIGLAEATPDCQTSQLSALRDCAAALDEVPSPDETQTIIVTKLSLDQVEASGLAELARDRHARLVVRALDDEPEAITARGWLALNSPFTRDDLSALVRALQGASGTA